MRETGMMPSETIRQSQCSRLTSGSCVSCSGRKLDRPRASAGQLDSELPATLAADEKERATTRKTVAETDAIYYDMGVVTSSEVRSSRFGSDEYSSGKR